MGFKIFIRDRKGISTTELLFSVAFIGLALLVVVILIDRSLAVKKANDLVRFNDVQLILSSLLLYEIDYKGAVPKEIDDEEETWQLIGIRGKVCTDICENRKVEFDCVYLDELVPQYLEFLPQAPGFTHLGPTGYYINKKKGTNILTVGACTTQIEPIIEIKQ